MSDDFTHLLLPADADALDHQRTNLLFWHSLSAAATAAAPTQPNSYGGFPFSFAPPLHHSTPSDLSSPLGSEWCWLLVLVLCCGERRRMDVEPLLCFCCPSNPGEVVLTAASHCLLRMHSRRPGNTKTSCLLPSVSRKRQTCQT